MTTFIRVRDRATKHQYDIAEQSFREDKHELLNDDRYPPARHPRPDKPFIQPAPAKVPEQSEQSEPVPAEPSALENEE